MGGNILYADDVNEAFTTLDFVCPFCKKEIQDTDEVMIGNSDNLDSFSLEDGAKTFMHIKCYEESKKDDK